MSHRQFKSLAAGMVLISAVVQGQPSRTKAPPAAKAWTPARTPDGQPDFQGVWATATLTPLERPAEFAGKAFLTEQEAAEFERRTLQRVNSDRRDGDKSVDLNRNYNEFWRDRGTKVAGGRTSLVVDPPDGRVPLTAAARAKQAAARAAEQAPTGPQDLPLRLRCITRGLPMLPTPNNNYFQIVQSAGFFVMLQEMMYEARIIPLTGPPSTRPHRDPRISGYMGDSRAWWEDNTLVVDTTNISATSDFFGAGPGLHLVERYTRTEPGTILYQFTAEDPASFTRPWSAELPMRKTDEGIFDYACHAGNYTMEGVLAGARSAEKKAAGESAKGLK